MSNDATFTFTALDQRASGTITIVDYTLLSGKTFTVGVDTLTEGSDFNAATSNDATATALATAIDAIASVGASANGAVVTVTADAPGTAGNSKALSTNADAEAATVSGATLTGGVAATYTDPFLVDPEYNTVYAYLDVDTLAGGSPTLDVTPEVSMDKNGDYQQAENDSESGVAFTQQTGAGQDQQKIINPLNWLRFKIVLGGTNPLFTGTLKVLAKKV